MPTDYKKIQAARRKTLFPLSARELGRCRARFAVKLRAEGFSVYAIRQIMGLSPDKVRNYLAKGAKLLK